MTEVFLATLSPMLVLFLCMVIGFVLNKKKLTPDNTTTVLSNLETYVLVPSLTLNTFMRYCTVESLAVHYPLVLFSALIVVLALLLAYPMSRFFEKKGYTRNVYKYALTFGNFGFMGNALVPAILGEDMLYYYLLFTLPVNLVAYAWGVPIMIPESKRKKNPLANLLHPVFFAIVIGATLGLTGVAKYVPDFVTTAIGNLSACMGPVAMLLTGFVVGSYPIKGLLSNKKVYFAAALRLFLLPAVYIVLLKLLGAGTMAMQFCLFAYATPLGLNTVVFPASFGGETATGASMAMVSHTVCVITIPIMYTLLTMFLL